MCRHTLVRLSFLVFLLSHDATPLTGTSSTGWEWTGGPGGSIVMALTTTPRGTMLAGLENGGLYRSTDGGFHWAEPSGIPTWPCCNYSVFALASGEAAVYAGTWGGGVRRSDDDGETWFDCGTIPGEGYPIVLALAVCRFGDRVYAGGNFGVARSDDGGVTWSDDDAGLPGSWVRSLALRGTTLYALSDNGIFRHPDGDGGWEAWSAGLSATTGLQSLSVTAEALFLATHDGGIFRLDCADSTWVALNAGLWDDNADALVEVDRTLYAGTMGSGVFRLNPENLTWDWIDNGLYGRDIRSMTGRRESPVVGTYGAGVYAYDPTLDLWAARNTGLVAPSLTAVAVDGANVYAASNGGGVWRSADSGVTWTAVRNAHPPAAIFCFAVGGGRVFAGSWDGVWLSQDQGVTWTAAGLQGRGVFALLWDAGVLHAGTWDGTVWSSLDLGANWTQRGTGLPNSRIHGVALRPDGLYASVDGHGIYRLPTAATTWSALNAGLPELTAPVLISSGAGLLAGLEGEGIYRWNAMSGVWEARGLAHTAIHALIDAGGELLAGGWGQLFRSTDAGVTWNSDTSGLKPWLAVRALARGPGWFYAGLDCGGVWRQPDGTTGAILPPPAAPELQMQVAPNPARRNALIHFNLDRPGRVELTVHDVAGRCVATLLSDRLNDGPHEQLWPARTTDGSPVAAGLYFIRLKVDNREITARAVRVK